MLCQVPDVCRQTVRCEIADTGALARNRLTCPLFDTDAYCRSLESAYRLMWERWKRGKPPATFTVDTAAPAQRETEASGAQNETVTLQA